MPAITANATFEVTDNFGMVKDSFSFKFPNTNIRPTRFMQYSVTVF